MAHNAYGFLGAMVMAAWCGTAAADDAIVMSRVGTMQAVSAGATVVIGDEWCFFSCGGSQGLALSGEVGLGGVKGALGLGFAEREDGRGLLVLQAAVLRAWDESSVLPHGSVFVGPELEIAADWGVSLGAFKRVDASGWRFSLGVQRTF